MRWLAIKSILNPTNIKILLSVENTLCNVSICRILTLYSAKFRKCFIYVLGIYSSAYYVLCLLHVKLTWSVSIKKPLRQHLMTNYGTLMCSTSASNACIAFPWRKLRCLTTCGILCLYALSGRTSYRKMKWSLEAGRFWFKFSNRSEIWQAHRQRAVEWFDHYNTKSCAFETSRDIRIRRPPT